MPFGEHFKVANKARTNEVSTTSTEKAKTMIPTTKEAKATTTTTQAKTKTRVKEKDYTTKLGTINQKEQRAKTRKEMAPTKVARKAYQKASMAQKGLINNIQTTPSTITGLLLSHGTKTHGTTILAKINGMIKAGTSMTTTIGHGRMILLSTINMETLHQQLLQF